MTFGRTIQNTVEFVCFSFHAALTSSLSYDHTSRYHVITLSSHKLAIQILKIWFDMIWWFIDECIMCKCLQIIRAKYYVSNWASSKLTRLLNRASKFALFSVSGLKDEKLIKKANLHETETSKLYSGVFWIFLPNVIKIDTTVPKLVRFETPCIVSHQEMSPKHLIYTVSQKTTQLWNGIARNCKDRSRRYLADIF